MSALHHKPRNVFLGQSESREQLLPYHYLLFSFSTAFFLSKNIVGVVRFWHIKDYEKMFVYLL